MGELSAAAAASSQALEALKQASEGSAEEAEALKQAAKASAEEAQARMHGVCVRASLRVLGCCCGGPPERLTVMHLACVKPTYGTLVALGLDALLLWRCLCCCATAVTRHTKVSCLAFA